MKRLFKALVGTTLLLAPSVGLLGCSSTGSSRETPQAFTGQSPSSTDTRTSRPSFMGGKTLHQSR